MYRQTAIQTHTNEDTNIITKKPDRQSYIGYTQTDRQTENNTYTKT